MLELIPCYEGASHGSEFSPFHRLHGAMSADELAAFLYVWACYGGEAGKAHIQTPREAMDALLKRKGGVIAGGLIARKGGLILEPGCCAGLEDWPVWQEIRRGEPGPWLGHDPAPWIDTSGPAAILHTDGGQAADGILPQEDETLEVTYEEIASAAHLAGETLAAFLVSFERWLRTVNRGRATRLARLAASAFSIPRHRP